MQQRKRGGGTFGSGGRLAFLVCTFALLLGACTGSRPLAGPAPLSRTMDAPPAAVLAAAASIFPEYGIRVAYVDTAAGEIRSERQELGRAWGNSLARNRLDCPGAGRLPAVNAVMGVSVHEEEGRTVVDLKVWARAAELGNAGTHGAACTLKPGFAEALFGAIEARAVAVDTSASKPPLGAPGR